MPCLDDQPATEPPRELAATTSDDVLERVRLRRVDAPATLDMRGTVLLADQDAASPHFAPRPLVIGDLQAPEGLCLLAPYIRGIHDRALGWEHLKHDPGGGDQPAIRIGGTGWARLEGARVDNMMNGVRPAGDGLVVRNAWFRWIRDDCIANDDLRALHVQDSLLDGCYTVLSARPERGSGRGDGPRATATMVLERVLVKVTPMPGGHNVFDPAVRTFGHLWKWSDAAGPAVIRDSIILVEDPGTFPEGGLPWPDGVAAEDVVLVWAGPGRYPGGLPSRGVTVVEDLAVWHDARADWLARHGCRSIDDCDVGQLLNPRPPG